jgi:integrase
MSGSTPLDLGTIDAMIDAMHSKRDQAALLLSCGCGLRTGTLTQLKINAVLNPMHELTGRLEIPRRALKGKHKAHALPIPNRALKALSEWIAIHPAPHRQAPLFPSEKTPDAGLCPRQWQRIFKAAANAAASSGKLTPHSARKFFAHAIYSHTGQDIQLTTRALGNKSPMATMHYLDFGGSKISAATLDIFNDRTQRELIPATPE